MRTPASMLGVATALAIAAGSASAQDFTTGDWKFRAQIYGWFPTVSGETAFPSNGTTTGIDAGNYLDALRFAFMGGLEARRGRVGALLDFIYLDFDAEKAGTRDLSIGGPLGVIDIPAGVSADANLRLRGWAWTLAGSYALAETPRYEMQLLGGLRYLKVDTTLDWNFRGDVGAVPTLARRGSSTVKPNSWDGIVGAKGRVKLGADGRWFVPYYLDVGAGEADLTWQAMGGVGYAFEWGEVFAAYRHLDYRFASDSDVKDLSFSGPGIALGFRW